MSLVKEFMNETRKLDNGEKRALVEQPSTWVMPKFKSSGANTVVVRQQAHEDIVVWAGLDKIIPTSPTRGCVKWTLMELHILYA